MAGTAPLVTTPKDDDSCRALLVNVRGPGLTYSFLLSTGNGKVLKGQTENRIGTWRNHLSATVGP